MLSLPFSKAVFISHLVFLITSPVLSYEHPTTTGEFSKDSIDSTLALQMPLNKHAAKFVKQYIHQNNESLEKIKRKHGATFSMMDGVFKKYGLPVELKYLAVVESELKSTAVSRVGAAGPWQIMPVTAKELGLKITATTDERTHYRKSTKAAALYLRDLYREYGDWLLALAAYNCGPGPVNTAIRKSGSRNFWKLQNYLPAESRGHVKKFIATHYYFEGKGSVTTLTKTERANHIKAMAAWAAKQQEIAAEPSTQKLVVLN